MNDSISYIDPNERQNLSYTLLGSTLYLEKELVISQISHILPALENVISEYSEQNITINLEKLEHIDSAGVVAIEYIQKKLTEKGVENHIEGGSDLIKKKFEVFFGKTDDSQPIKKRESFLAKIGDQVYQFFTVSVLGFLNLTANIFYWSIVDLFYRKSHKKGEFFNQAVLIGVNAVPIVLGLSFIIGLVLALQSAAQLRNFGANIYIVDLTVIAMMREMGPLITAILVAGRSGSSIAAEIATMKVTSELDALTTMALNPIRFVIVPKIHGAVFTMPLLTILANVMGIMGGGLVAYLYLDIAPEIFYGRMGDSLFIRDIVTGIIKSLFFAGIIVLTGTYFGFQVEKGAEGVGRMTTQAVVVAITLVIIADSIFSLIFY